MTKILSRSGDSLADVYDIEGSIAGIEQLETRELPIVHEMGATLFSERFSTTTRRATTGNLLQDVNFAINLTDLPGTPTRLLGVTVLTNNAARILRAAVMVRDSVGTTRESPIWVWDAATSLPIRLVEEGTEADFDVLVGSAPTIFVPNFVGGRLQPQVANEFIIRGRTTGFGAGTVFVTALYYIAFGQIGGISSRGLPIPGW